MIRSAGLLVALGWLAGSMGHLSFNRKPEACAVAGLAAPQPAHASGLRLNESTEARADDAVTIKLKENSRGDTLHVEKKSKEHSKIKLTDG